MPILTKWIGPGVTVLAFTGFAVFLVLRLQQGFERRATEWFETADEAPADRGEVSSTEVEFTRFDEQGRLVVQGRAKQALGRTDDQQRFLEVEVRLVGVHAGGDAVVAADELLLDSRTEVVEFLGNALLSVEGLELSGPHLQYRRAPDRLWSSDPVQFRSDDFVGIAASMQFEIEGGDVSLSGVAAAPAMAGGFAVVAERVRFDGETNDTTLFGDVEIVSDQLELFSSDSVTARRDREANRMRSLEAGFGTVLSLLPAPVAEDAAPDLSDEEQLVLRGDEVEIELEGGRVPRLVRVKDSPSFRRGRRTDLQGQEGTLALDSEGAPEWIRLRGEVTSRLPAGEDGGQLISVDSSQLEVAFSVERQIAEATFDGSVEARYGRASATAESARWNGSDTLVLGGNPRVVDSSLLELEGADLRLIIAEPGRVEAAGGVAARFLPERLDWLPGEFDGAVLTGDTAVVETGQGQGVFTGAVRLLFGKNRLLANEIRVDAEGRTVAATGTVATSLAFEVPAPNPAAPGDPTPDAAGLPAEPEAGGADGALEGAETPPGGASTASLFVFAAEAEGFHYASEDARLSYSGSPTLEREEPSGEVSRVSAGRIEVDLMPDGSLGAVRGVQGARFARGSNRVRGSRIRYEPGADVLLAWGFPAALEVDGRTSEGGRLELAFTDNRTRIHPTPLKRAVTRGRVGRREATARR